MIKTQAVVNIDKGKFTAPYEKYESENLLDCITLELKEGESLTPEQSNAIKAVDALFPVKKVEDKIVPNALTRTFGDCDYGRDLGVKARVRQAFERTLEDPSKVVVNGIKAMITAGFTLEDAYALTKAQRDSKGTTTPTIEEVKTKLK